MAVSQTQKSPQDIAALKKMVQAIESPATKTLSCSSLGLGIPYGGMTQVVSKLGAGKTEFVVRVLASQPDLKVVWIEKAFSFYPPSLRRYDLYYHQILFCEAGEESLWTAYQVIQSSLYDVIVFNGDLEDELHLRRLQILLKKMDKIFLLISPHVIKDYAWTIKLQVQVQSLPGSPCDHLQIHVLRGKGFQLEET